MPTIFHAQNHETMRAAYFRAFQGTDFQHYFTLHSRGNGEAILRSEGYTTKASRDDGIESVRRHSPTRVTIVNMVMATVTTGST